jgi:hypothetical protein
MFSFLFNIKLLLYFLYLPQPSQNDFSVQDLADKCKKDGEFIVYYYNITRFSLS